MRNEGRFQNFARIRNLVGSVGFVRNPSLLSMDELRLEAHKILFKKKNFLLLEEQALLAEFIVVDGVLAGFVCVTCNDVSDRQTCYHGLCHYCCSIECEGLHARYWLEGDYL